MDSALAASVEEKEIVSFFLPAERLRLEMESTLPSLITQLPALSDEISKIPSRFDVIELADRTATVLEGKLSEKEIISTLKFIKTPAGQAMQNLLRQSDPKKRQAIENKVDPALLRQIGVFAGSALGQKLLALLNSPDAATIQSNYGQEVMCSIIKESKPKTFEKLHAQGACIQ